jgi:hypothetical protein
MAVEAATVVRGRVWATRSGRRPLSRVEAGLARQDPALLWGQARPPHAFNDETVGRVRDRRAAMGPRPRFTAWALRAATPVGVGRREGPCETTSPRGWGASDVPEAQDLPCRSPAGDRQDTRPALTPFVRSTLGVERAVPRGGTPEEGPAAATPLTPTLRSEIAPLLAR